MRSIRSGPHAASTSADKPARFRAEHQHVVRAPRDFVVTDRPARRECEPARGPAEAREAGGKIVMDRHLGQFVVVEPRTAYRFLVQPESQRLHEVEARAGIGAQPDDVAGVGGNFGFDQDDLEWHRIGPWGQPGRLLHAAREAFAGSKGPRSLVGRRGGSGARGRPGHGREARRRVAGHAAGKTDRRHLGAGLRPQGDPVGPLVRGHGGRADHEFAGDHRDAGRSRATLHGADDRASHPPPARCSGRTGR